MVNISRLLANRLHEMLVATAMYVSIACFFLLGLIRSVGDVAQADWSIPITASAAARDAHSLFFVWMYNTGFGAPGIGRWGFPFFPLLNAALAPLGIVGGTEIKVLAVFLVAFAGVTTYLLARSFNLGFVSSFLCGLFFMTTAVLFDWLLFGWLYYIVGYALLPLSILATKKFLETKDLRYALINGLVLAVAMEQPTFILIYPLVGFLFAAFEYRLKVKIVLRQLLLTVISLSIWFLTALSFFTSFNNEVTFTSYQGDLFTPTLSQFSHLAYLSNSIRFWGSTFNFQFETYFPPQLVIFSFLIIILASIAILLKPKDGRVLYATILYLFALLSSLSYKNLHFLVYNLPYGSIWLAPSIFLVPASLGLALLLGFGHQTLSSKIIECRRLHCKRFFRVFLLAIFLTLIVTAGFPWWSGQASGEPVSGPVTKLNLYSLPPGYTSWSVTNNATDDYYAMYLFSGPNVQLSDTDFFSGPYQGVNGAIFFEINGLPYVAPANTGQLLNELVKYGGQVGESWGSKSIKYIVVYTNIEAAYNLTDVLSLLNSQNGFKQIVNSTDLLVFENSLAKPVVYADNASLTITYHDPTLYKVQVNSSSPFTLFLNQQYYSGWVASVNGTRLTTHFKNSDGFNSWYLNSTGNMEIEIYYEPQAAYFASMLISSATIISVVLLVTILSIRKHLPKRRHLEI